MGLQLVKWDKLGLSLDEKKMTTIFKNKNKNMIGKECQILNKISIAVFLG